MGSQAHTIPRSRGTGRRRRHRHPRAVRGVTPLVPSCPTAEPVRQRSGCSGASAVANSPILHHLLGCHVGHTASRYRGQTQPRLKPALHRVGRTSPVRLPRLFRLDFPGHVQSFLSECHPTAAGLHTRAPHSPPKRSLLMDVFNHTTSISHLKCIFSL